MQQEVWKSKQRKLRIECHGVKRSRLTTFHIEVSWELIRVVLRSGRGSRGDINTLEVEACGGEGKGVGGW